MSAQHGALDNQQPGLTTKSLPLTETQLAPLPKAFIRRTQCQVGMGRDLSCGRVRSAVQEQLLRCMTDPQMDARAALEALPQSALSEDQRCDVLALRGQLACGVLAHCLKMRHLVDYGVNRWRGCVVQATLLLPWDGARLGYGAGLGSEHPMVLSRVCPQLRQPPNAPFASTPAACLLLLAGPRLHASAWRCPSGPPTSPQTAPSLHSQTLPSC